MVLSMSDIKHNEILIPDDDPRVLNQSERICSVYGCNSKRFDETEVSKTETYTFKSDSGKMKTIEVPVTVVVHTCRKCRIVQEDLKAVELHDHDSLHCSICTQIWTQVLRESISDNKAKKKNRFATQNKDGSYDLVDDLGIGDPQGERSEAIMEVINKAEEDAARIRKSPKIYYTDRDVHDPDAEILFYKLTSGLTKCLGSRDTEFAESGCRMFEPCGLCNACVWNREQQEYIEILETPKATFKTQDWERKKKRSKYFLQQVLDGQLMNHFERNSFVPYRKQMNPKTEGLTFKKYFGHLIRKQRFGCVTIYTPLRASKMNMPYKECSGLLKRYFQLSKQMQTCEEKHLPEIQKELDCIELQLIKDERYYEPRFVQVGVWNEAMQRTEWNKSVDLNEVTTLYKSVKNQRGLREYPWTENFEISLDMLVDASNEKFIDDNKIWSTNKNSIIHVSMSTDSTAGINIGTQSDDSLEEQSEDGSDYQ